ncbi:MAG: hypothetical protein OJF51_001969 [Nitrospira sp.]|jgi:hypothetical protein|nr:MAG: hypothetical protein OJF51_001969 [Nitrospira sp.]
MTTSTFAGPAQPACVPANSFKLCTLKTQKGTDDNVDLIIDKQSNPLLENDPGMPALYFM